MSIADLMNSVSSAVSRAWFGHSIRNCRTRPTRGPLRQMACLSSPFPRWLLGSCTVVLLALLVVYNDHINENLNSPKQSCYHSAAAKIAVRRDGVEMAY